MIDLRRTRFIVTCWPDNRWPVQVVTWLESLTASFEPRNDYRYSLVKKNVVCARNTAVKVALESDESYDWFVFLDRDVRPNIQTSPFLDLTTDIKVCQVAMHSHLAWSRPDSFHEAIWCASRKTLESIEPPWFMQEFSPDGTEMQGCICQYFRKKALAAGASISHGGWAEHDKDSSWCS